MESILITKELQQSLLPYRQLPTYFGYPRVRRLDKYFYKLDLEKFNIIVKDPIDCMNFIIEHMIYTSDKITHNAPEHWLQSAQEVYKWIFDIRKDDCDGAAVSLGSVLYSLNNPDIRIGIGYYGDPRYANTKTQRINHAYNMIHKDNKYYLLDAVGDRQMMKLDLMDNHPEYITYVSAAPDGRIWLHGPSIQAFT
jgi:hypothetical protein